MGYVESAVVIYLRNMASGNPGQIFPLKFMEPNLGFLEIGREAATIVMLLAVGYLAGRNRLQKWMFFIYSFAIWDMFYYIILKITIGWPSSLLDFDVLFLIPVIWIGPVITPILISLLLVIGSLAIISVSERSSDVQIGTLNLWLFVLGCVTVFYSFTWQTFHILITVGPKGIQHFTPRSFDWLSFMIGYLIMCLSTAKTIRDCLYNSKIPSAGIKSSA